MNAYTTKEYTTFYLRLLSEDLDLGLDILSDIMWDPALRPDEVDAEREVILDEVLMHLDEPSDVVYEKFSEAVFPGHPLGREVLGLPEVITSVAVPDIRAFFDHHYRPGNIVVAAAGDLDHDDLADGLNRRFNGGADGAPPERVAPGDETIPLDVTTRDSEQAHLVLGMRGLARRSPDRFALSLLNHVLGGGLSSRLFQKLREERGLCYSVASDRIAYGDVGALAVAVGTAPSHVPEVLDLVVDELADLAEHGVTDRELALAKGHVRADTLLSLEDSGARMGRIGAALLLHGEVMEVADVSALVDAVSTEDVARVAREVLASPRSLAVVGPFGEEDFPTAHWR